MSKRKKKVESLEESTEQIKSKKTFAEIMEARKQARKDWKEAEEIKRKEFNRIRMERMAKVKNQTIVNK